MKKIEIYTTGLCGYCFAAKRLLDSKSVEYNEVRVDKLPDRRQEMEERSGRRTVPQIFIEEVHVGGYDDLARLDHAGELDPLIAD